MDHINFIPFLKTKIINNRVIKEKKFAPHNLNRNFTEVVITENK